MGLRPRRRTDRPLRDGRWWADCSLPLRAARAMLKTLEPRGTVGCFLAPPLAAHVGWRWTRRNRTRPSSSCSPMSGRCGSCFSPRTSPATSPPAACGSPAATTGLARCDACSTIDGLPTPTQFIRLPGADGELIDGLIQGSQAVFGQVIAARAAEIRRRCAEWKPGGDRHAASASSPGRASGCGMMRAGAASVDRRTPAATSNGTSSTPTTPSAPPRAAGRTRLRCDGLITANTSRADAPELLPLELPWLTWVTTPDRVPSALGGSERQVAGS